FSLFLDYLWNNKFKYIVFILLVVITFMNLHYLISSHFFSQQQTKAEGSNIPFPLQNKVVNTIVNDAGGKKFRLKRVGELDFFEKEYAQNYVYLLWLKGNEPVQNSKLMYIIIEENFPYEVKNKNIKTIAQISNIKVLREI